MASMLYIESSPRKERSHSIEIAQTFIDEYQQSHPVDVINILDLWKIELPVFDGEVINAKYAILHGQKHTDKQKEAWSAVERVIKDFTSADKYLISLPMWNFGIPYKLKHYIDVLVQPGYTFSYSPTEGYKGLVTGKSAVLIYARGGAYGSGTGGEKLDMQKSYMETVLGFIGFSNIQSIVIEPTLKSTPEELEKIKDAAKEQAKTISRNF